MEYVVIGLLIVIIILLVVSLTKGVDETNITERLSKLEVTTVKELGDFKTDINRTLNEDFNNLNERIEVKLRLINDRVSERIDENFEKTNKTFTSILERITKIDEAQKKIDMLSNDIVSLQGILTDKKARGTFGEVNLRHIMSSIFGANNDKLYRMQHSFGNGTIVDCVLFAPEPLGVIAIDSKFPLENYQQMVDKNNSQSAREQSEKMFKLDMKKHIDDISAKYIIDGVTSDQAILFLPAEAIFAEVNAYHQDLVDYSYKKKVWLTSPTTLISTLTTIQIIIKNIERDKYASIIHQELNLLSKEFERYRTRWDKLYRSIETISKDAQDIYITTDKISKRFTSINQVEIENEEVKEISQK
ncbi:MAG: DNA recombination protein RmuC [Bacilli bacterium]|nr:DNA recombination protein RmuC [Bacilli bacterium]MDD4809192.1 DNA recombination protein RmuC [Bacilli bacterium]